MTREKAYEILDKHPLCNECDSSFPYNCNECGEAFLTAFDALKQPEIVRCKNCKHQDPDRFDDGEGNYVCRKGHGWKPDNWFCADGERNDGEKK